MPSSTTPSVIICMADYGHDPTETALPWKAFKDAGFDISFATELGGTAPACDSRMMEGWTGAILGANKATIEAYKAMTATTAFQNPLSWTSPNFNLSAYTLVHLPGGHDKGVQQVIDSKPLHKHLGIYWKLCARNAESRHAIAAVCHGVLVLARTSDTDTKVAADSPSPRSVLYTATTTALVAMQEQTIFQLTRPLLGDYYKTYGAGSPSVEEEVKSKLEHPDVQWKGSMALSGFVVEDDRWNYVSARYPGDVPAFCEKVVEMARRLPMPDMAKA